jgi:hypothetical protein
VKAGDLVKHPAMRGSGIILSVEGGGRRAYTLWTVYGQTKQQNVATRYLEVISESR